MWILSYSIIMFGIHLYIILCAVCPFAIEFETPDDAGDVNIIS